jgi:hypothetical protein
MLTWRSPEIGGAYNIDLRKFFDLSIFRFQSRIIQTNPADSRLALRGRFFAEGNAAGAV